MYESLRAKSLLFEQRWPKNKAGGAHCAASPSLPKMARLSTMTTPQDLSALSYTVPATESKAAFSSWHSEHMQDFLRKIISSGSGSIMLPTQPHKPT